MNNITLRYRDIIRLGFQINEVIYAYQNIIAMMISGKIQMIETKGNHLDNDESAAKAKSDHQWGNLAGLMHRYFMVLQIKTLDSYDWFMEIVMGQ